MSEQKLDDHARRVREAAGLLIVGLADELARPLASVRDGLASAVAHLDEHAATAKGPDPLSYDDSKLIRETVADAYLKTATTARLVETLAASLSGPTSIESADLSGLLDDAVALVKHRFSASTELFIDLGTLPPIPIAPSDLILAVARILLYCADSTRLADEAAVSIRSRLIGESPRSEARITIAENGRGGDDVEMAQVSGLARALASRLGGSCEVASEPGAGATFELRFPLGAR